MRCHHLSGVFWAVYIPEEVGSLISEWFGIGLGDGINPWKRRILHRILVSNGFGTIPDPEMNHEPRKQHISFGQLGLEYMQHKISKRLVAL